VNKTDLWESFVMSLLLDLPHLHLPIADATQLIVALAIIIFSILGSLLQSRQEAKKQREKRETGKRGRRSDMIEDLLRESSHETPRPRPQKRAPPATPVVEAEVVQESVAEHVAQTFQTTMARGDSVPGQPGSLAREKMAERVPERRRRGEKATESPAIVPTGLPDVIAPQATPNQISSEVTASEIAASSDSPLMQGLAGMLSSPEGIATAIVLKEILERPESRWR